MPLKQKVLFLIVFLNTISFISVFFIVRYLLVHKFEEFEESAARKDISRIELALNQRIESTAILVKDWSIWDDSFKFIQDKNAQFIAENIVNPVFNNVNVNLIAFYDLNNKLAYGKYFDFDSQTQKEIPDSIIDTISDLPSLESSTSASGLVDSQYGMMYFSSHPIMPSSGTGPVAGNLVMAKILDKKDVSSIETTTDLHFNIYTNNINGEKFNNLLTQHNLVKDDQLEIVGNNLHIRHLINDIYNKPALILDLESPREINAQGAQIMRYLFVAYILSLVMTILFALLFLHTLLVGPFSSILSDVKRITLERNFSARLKDYKEKEFKEMATSINMMLESLNNTESELLATNENMRQKALELEAKTSELERLNAHFVGREIRMAELKKEIAQLRDKLGMTDSSNA